MRVAVVSDIHSNLHALEAVLAAIDAEAPDELWCLGDLVGYGPRPNECCAAIAERATICLAGNHDLGVLGRLDLFHGSPRDAAWDYVLSFDVAVESFELTTAPLIMVGHSHVAMAIRTHD